jgi:uncharacterized protein (DUF427 family)
MGVLLVSCPETGREFSTGIQLDEVTFRMLTATLSTAYCPYCGTEHRWTPREARLAEAIPPREWVESFASEASGPADE